MSTWYNAKGEIVASGEVGDVVMELHECNQSLRADLAAARALLSEAQDELYEGGSPDLLRRIIKYLNPSGCEE